MSARSLCIYAGPVGDGFWRPCSHPVRGGRCRKRVECKTCTLHRAEPLVPDADVIEAQEPDVPEPVECVHRQEMRAAEVAAVGLNPAKRWGLCMLPSRPLGKHVCPCTGCGPKCPGYENE